MGLAGEDDLDRPLRVPQQARQPLDVGEQQARALVGREAPGEADRQDLGIERLLELLEHDRRLAVAGELAAAAGPGEDRQLASSGAGGPPTGRSSGIFASRSQNRPLGLPGRGRRGRRPGCWNRAPHRGPDPGRGMDAVGDAQDSASPRTAGQVALAVTAWSWLTAFGRTMCCAARGRSCRTGGGRRRRPGRAPGCARVDQAGGFGPVDPQERAGHPPHEVGVEALVAGRDRACGW